MNKYAYIGIAGALAMAASDIILLGQPASGSYYDLSSFGAVEHVGELRAALGSTLGMVSAFFTCFGFWYLKRMFNPVNERSATLLFILLSSMMFVGGAFHAGYYFLSQPGLNGHGYILPQATQEDFRAHLEMLSYLGVPGFVGGSILFFKLALNERYPNWLRYCNPLILTLIFLALFYFLPAPVGGYIRPTFINLATVALFLFTLRAPAKQNL
ncbi:MAG TPA: DUF6796 family protein [Chitinophagales bacterium]|nr:DUF6796 family protein [Chitinophagales bacterium]